ncbi:uncharacterized protein [Lepeophtheirus salmonis]|uniref:uncharacterized protein n=1 Tax=Lepeophtheirus salmonis TaxID=72036 RepID=UPI003AF38555
MKFLDLKPFFLSDETKSMIDQQIPTSYGCLIACLIQGPEYCKIWSYSIKTHSCRMSKNDNRLVPATTFDVAVFGRPYAQHTKCNITYDRQNFVVNNVHGFTNVGNIKTVNDIHFAKDCQEYCTKQPYSNSWIFTYSELCICRTRSMSAYELYPSKGTSTGITIPQKTYLNIKPSGRVKLIRLKNVNFGECAFYFQTFDPYGYLSNQVSTFFSYVPKGRLCYLGEAKQDKTMIHMVESKGTITGTKTGTYKMDGVVQEGISHESGDDDYGENLNSLCLVPDDLKISCSDDYKIKKADCARKNCCFNPDHPIKCYYEYIRGYHLIPPYVVFAYRNDTGIPISETKAICETVDFSILWPDLKNGGYTDKMIAFMKCVYSQFPYYLDEFHHINRKPQELRVIMCFKEMDTSVNIFLGRFGLDTNKSEYIKPKRTKGQHKPSGCFSGESWVTTQLRGSVPIGDVESGDEVLSHCTDSKCYYSRIIHEGKHAWPEDFNYIQIRLENGQKLELSHTHFLMVFEDAFSDVVKYVWARDVHLFKYLPIIKNNRTSRSKVVQLIQKRGSQAFHNPITESGLITVNGVVASVYAVAPGFIYKSNEISGHEFAHFLYSIVRTFKSYLPIGPSNEIQEGMDPITYFLTRRFEPVLYQMLGVQRGNSTYRIPGMYWLSLELAMDFFKPT